MRRAKRRTWAGDVCYQVVYTVPQRMENIKTSQPQTPRFETEEDRKAHRDGISLRRFVKLVNHNFSPTSCYSTLTFNKEYDVHTFEEATLLINRYVKRLQYRYPGCKIILVKGRGKGTGRIHCHMLSDGIPLEAISEVWGMGEVVRIEKLRAHNYYINEDGQKVDHGANYKGLAIYLHNHWTEEQGGRRWKATRTIKAPEPEQATEAVRMYTVDKPPVSPKGYILVSATATKYGTLHFEYVRKVEPQKRGRKKKGV